MSLMTKVFDDSQLGRLSEFTANLSLVFFASVVSQIFSGVDEVNWFMLVLGVSFTAGSLFISLLLAKERR